MDEETALGEFEEYVKNHLYPNNELTQAEWLALRLVWEESARRCSIEYEGKLALMISALADIKKELRQADRKAKLECAEICEARAIECARKINHDEDSYESTTLRSMAWQFSVLANKIRATIPEDRP